MTDSLRHRNSAIIITMVLAILVANTALTYLNLVRIDRNFNDVRRSQEVLLTLNAVMRHVVDAETGQRGYIITSDAAYLGPYNEARETVEKELRQLEQLVANDPAQRSRLGMMQSRVRLRLSQIAQTLEFARYDFELAREAVAGGEGKQTMESIRDAVGQMQSHEEALLLTQEQDSHVSYLTALVTIFIVALVGLAMIVVGFVMVNRDIVRRNAVEETMLQSVELLEQRVKQRTAEITEANAYLQDEVVERRRAEERAHQFAQELQRSNQELEQFASVASHDLQEPLRKIQAFGDRLREKCRDSLSDQGRDYLDRMLSSATRMRSLIDDLLAYARVSTKQQPFVNVNLRQLALDVATDLDGRLQQTGGEIEIGELPAVQADALQMRQLFLNLLGNAVKFHRPGVPPKVQVSGRLVERPLSPGGDGPVGWYCEVTVADNGIGFDQIYLDRIFQLFQRLHGRDEYEGTGMGLAICRKIVELHGGEITAYSSPGQGARFVFTLPVGQPASGAVA